MPNIAVSLHTPLVDILGCKYPILCAGMGGVARAQLAAAVSEAGGFGCMGMVRESPAFIRQQIEQYRSLSSRPFAVNIIPAATAPELLERQVETLIEMGVPAVCLFWDVRPEVVQRFRGAGVTVLYQVGSVVDAREALQAGADILIVQGVDAGGHVWATQSVYTLLPEVCRISAVPVVAAGGIATGQGIAAAMLLGAQGVSCGSAFLATFESNAHDYHKQRVIDAHADDTLYTTAFHINWPEGAAVRVLRNSVTDADTPAQSRSWERIEIGAQDDQPVFLHSTDSPLRGATGELERMALYAGRSCGDINGLCSAAARVQQLVQETSASLGGQVKEESLDPEQEEIREVSSSPCMAGEFSGDYFGHCDDEELYARLDDLLGSVRAVARVCAFSLAQAGCGYRHDLLLSVHAEAIKGCEGALYCMAMLGKQSHREGEQYFRECMAIGDFIERMQFVMAGQQRVVGRISELLPRVGQASILKRLQTMSDQHRNTIETLGLLISASA